MAYLLGDSVSLCSLHLLHLFSRGLITGQLSSNRPTVPGRTLRTDGHRKKSMVVSMESGWVVGSEPVPVSWSRCIDLRNLPWTRRENNFKLPRRSSYLRSFWEIYVYAEWLAEYTSKDTCPGLSRCSLVTCWALVQLRTLHHLCKTPQII